jgi:hypothetical protein
MVFHSGVLCCVQLLFFADPETLTGQSHDMDGFLKGC